VCALKKERGPYAVAGGPAHCRLHLSRARLPLPLSWRSHGGLTQISLLFIDQLFHAIQHSMQVGCGIFNVKIFILSRPTFDGKYSTTVNILEIAIGKLASSFRGYHD
jgi:hypothetical protein